MTAGEPAAAGPPRVIWWPDTSALITLAVSPAVRAAVTAAIATSPHTARILLARAIEAELTGLQRSDEPVAALARTALGQLAWTHSAVPLDDPAGVDLAIEIQNELAAGQPLRYPTEHWGEAAIISLASRSQNFKPQLLSDDYDARVAAAARGVDAIGVPMLISRMVQAGSVTCENAETWVAALARHRRCPAFTGAQLAAGTLGKHSLP